MKIRAQATDEGNDRRYQRGGNGGRGEIGPEGHAEKVGVFRGKLFSFLFYRLYLILIRLIYSNHPVDLMPTRLSSRLGWPAGKGPGHQDKKGDTQLLASPSYILSSQPLLYIMATRLITRPRLLPARVLQTRSKVTAPFRLPAARNEPNVSFAYNPHRMKVKQQY